ncbi:TauD/TfdA dioxygenase family protein [Hwanghaeella sp. LZ110]|uniref:TauD/TfdA dioxygenase family protein n=1 Tax=Hwanghaeella sp. LZ110 TaxID=3402810 RepID=UPI003B67D490
MRTTPLHRDFGVEVHDVSLKEITATQGYDELRRLFEEHSLLLFRDQDLSDEAQLEFGALFGPLEDRHDRPKPEISPVANLDAAGAVIASDSDKHVQNLRANFLWHTDSTFLPVPALVNVLQARILPNQGGETELVSTRAGFARLAPEVQERLRKSVFRHRYAHSRAKIDPELAKQALFTKWTDQEWKAVWRNPRTGTESLYIASHVCAVSGMDEAEGLAFVDELVDAMTVPEAIYSHVWRPNDVLVWDERATLHRGRAWPYEQARKLVSCCVSLQARDGLEDMRAHI